MKGLDLLKNLFVLVTSKFSEQYLDEFGHPKYRQIEASLTDDIIKKHMEGQITIGTFPVNDKGETKWFCVDIDLLPDIHKAEDFNFENYRNDLESLAQTVSNALKLKDLKTVVEHTGGKGMHVWVLFTKPVSALKAKSVIVPIIKSIVYDTSIINIEYFPTSVNSKSVKLPLGRDKRYDKFSQFLTLTPETERNEPKILYNIGNPFEAVFTKCEAFARLKEKADTEKNLRHEERFAVATMTSKQPEKYLSFVESYFFEGLSNYKKETTQTQLLEISNKIKPMTCDTLIEKGICQGRCQAIGNDKSPIAFFHNELIESGDASAGESIIIDPQQHLLKKSNGFYEITKKGEFLKISNYTIDIIEQEIITDDDDGKVTVLHCKATTESGDEFLFEMTKEEYMDNALFKSKIYEVIKWGQAPYINPRKIEQIRMCIDKYSKPKTVKKSKNFGYTKDRTIYYTPSVRIDKDSILPNEELKIEIGQGSKAADKLLDFSLITEGRSEDYWKSFIKEKIITGLYTNKHLIIAILTHVFGPFMKGYFGNADSESPYTLWLTGETGTGKTRLSLIIQRLFGQFINLHSWASTAYNLQATGYYYKDAVFCMDDFKFAHFPNPGDVEKAMSILQTAYDKQGRGRLNRNGEISRTYVIRGNILVNGEDILSSQASLVARMILLNIKTADRIYDPKLYNEVQDISLNINELTPYIVKFCFTLDPVKIETAKEYYQQKVADITKDYSNGPRLAENFSKLLIYGTQGVIDYFWSDLSQPQRESMYKEFETYIMGCLDYQMSIVAEETLATKVWDALNLLISTGKVRIVLGTNRLHELDKKSGIPIVGFIDKMDTYIIPTFVYKELKEHFRTISPLTHSQRAIEAALYEAGITVEEKTVRRVFNTRRISVLTVTNKFGEILKKEAEQ